MNFHLALSQLFDIPYLLLIAKLSLAMLLGLFLGIERAYAHKTAGMRTYALVSVASALFTSISVTLASSMALQFPGAFNVAYIPGSIIIGIGFLGAGLIIFKDGHIENLRRPQDFGLPAGIGIATGFGLFKEAIFATLLTFFVLGGLSYVERRVRLTFFPDPQFEQTFAAEHAAPKKPRTRKVKVTAAE